MLTIVVGAAGVAIALVTSLLDTTATEGLYSAGDLDDLFIGVGIVVMAFAPLVAPLGHERPASSA